MADGRIASTDAQETLTRRNPADPRRSFFRLGTIICDPERREKAEMADPVMVEIPLTPEAAEALADPERRERIGRLVSSILHPAMIRWPGFSPRSKEQRMPTG